MSNRTDKRILKAHEKAVKTAAVFAEAYQDMLNAFYALGHATGYAGHPSTLPFPKPEPRPEFNWTTNPEGWAGDDS